MSDIDVETLQCCGIGEIAGIQDEQDDYEEGCDVFPTPIKILSDFKGRMPYRYPVVIFSVNNDGGRTQGDRLARYIRKHKLGRVTATAWGLNPNSSCKIRVFTWAVDWKIFGDFKLV